MLPNPTTRVIESAKYHENKLRYPSFSIQFLCTCITSAIISPIVVLWSLYFNANPSFIAFGIGILGALILQRPYNLLWQKVLNCVQKIIPNTPHINDYFAATERDPEYKNIKADEFKKLMETIREYKQKNNSVQMGDLLNFLYNNKLLDVLGPLLKLGANKSDIEQIEDTEALRFVSPESGGVRSLQWLAAKVVNRYKISIPSGKVNRDHQDLVTASAKFETISGALKKLN
ncbi:MAG: hypothetical protein ACHQJ6_05200 [Candidatus Berkiellales bacterium]